MACAFFPNNIEVMEKDGWLVLVCQQYRSNGERWLDGMVLFSSTIQMLWTKMAGWLLGFYANKTVVMEKDDRHGAFFSNNTVVMVKNVVMVGQLYALSNSILIISWQLECDYVWLCAIKCC